MNTYKEQLRKYYLNLRNKLPDEIIKNKNDSIFKNLKKYLRYKFFVKKIGIYYSVNSEVDTIKIIDWLLKNKYKVYLPKILNYNESDMEFVQIYSLSDLEKNNHYFFEPKGIKFIDPKTLDLLLIPLLCFDKNRNRLGMGKGFYDKYLKRTYAKKIGLAFQIQQHYLLQVNNWDEKLDLIITENGEN